MDIIITKAELVSALARVQGIVEKKNTVPILSSVLLEARGSELFVSATDLEIFLRSRYEVKAAKEGVVTAPAKKFFEIVRELPEGDVRIVAGDKGWLRIEMGRARFKVMSLPKDDFPALPTGQEGEKIEVGPAVLAEAIEKTSFAMSHDQTRQALNGILLEVAPSNSADEADLRLIATDGHRLAFLQRRCRAALVGPRGVIVPRKAIAEVRKLIGEEGAGAAVGLSFQDNRLFVNIGSSLLVTRLVDGQFPDYQQVIPAGGTRVAIIEREPFYRAVRRVSTVTADRVSLMRFAFSAGKIAVTASNPELGEATEDVEMEFTGGDIELGLNARYVQDVFSVLEQEKVVIELNEALSPVLIRPLGDDGYRCVVMPMRL